MVSKNMCEEYIRGVDVKQKKNYYGRKCIQIEGWDLCPLYMFLLTFSIHRWIPRLLLDCDKLLSRWIFIRYLLFLPVDQHHHRIISAQLARSPGSTLGIIILPWNLIQELLVIKCGSLLPNYRDQGNLWSVSHKPDFFPCECILDRNRISTDPSLWSIKPSDEILTKQNAKSDMSQRIRLSSNWHFYQLFMGHQ